MKTRYLIDCVLLDLDGTLFDTEALYRKVWKSIASEYGVALDDDVYNQYFLGVGVCSCIDNLKRLLNQANKSIKSNFIQLIKQKEDEIYASGVPFKLGTEVLLEYLKKLLLPVGIVTNSQSSKIGKVFSNTPYLSYFDLIISAEDVTNGKPHPEPYLRACRLLNKSPANTLVVEDSNVGAQAAISAGCCCVVIPNTFTKLDAHVQSRAVGIASSLLGVKEMLISGDLITVRSDQPK